MAKKNRVDLLWSENRVDPIKPIQPIPTKYPPYKDEYKPTRKTTKKLEKSFEDMIREKQDELEKANSSRRNDMKGHGYSGLYNGTYGARKALKSSASYKNVAELLETYDEVKEIEERGDEVIAYLNHDVRDIEVDNFVDNVLGFIEDEYEDVNWYGDVMYMDSADDEYDDTYAVSFTKHGLESSRKALKSSAESDILEYGYKGHQVQKDGTNWILDNDSSSTFWSLSDLKQYVDENFDDEDDEEIDSGCHKKSKRKSVKSGFEYTYEQYNSIDKMSLKEYISKLADLVDDDNDNLSDDQYYFLKDLLYSLQHNAINSSSRKSVKSSRRSIKSEYDGEDDESEYNEEDVFLTIINDGNLYRQLTTPIITNLKKKYLKGIFDEEKAKQAFQYLADEGVKRYDKEWGSGRGSLTYMPKADRMKLAERLCDYYMEHITE